MGKNNKTAPTESEQVGSETNSPRPTRRNSLQNELHRTNSMGPESLEEFGEPTKFDPDFSGPIRKRVCTGKSVIWLSYLIANFLFLCPNLLDII